MLTEEQQQTANNIGTEHGKDAASWVEIPDVATARRWIQGLDDIDPMVIDALPSSPLSGEWRDEYGTGDLVADIIDANPDCDGLDDDDIIDACDIYDMAFHDAMQEEIYRRASEMLESHGMRS